MNARILVIGRSGQVASALARAPTPDGVTLEALGRDRLDLSDLAAIPANLREFGADVVINAASGPSVDGSETEQGAAFLMNRDAPAALARACAGIGAPLVHLSTDCVFDGAKIGPYVETDAKAPLSVYARSKSEGEDAVLQSSATASVLRTSWVFSGHGKSFVSAMLNAAQTRDEVRVVSDQIGNPTYTPDLAQACIALALWLKQQSAGGHIFHYAGADAVTRAEQAESIFAAAAARGIKRSRVIPVATADYPTPATRPLNARLDSSRIVQTLGLKLRPWRETLALCMDERKAAT